MKKIIISTLSVLVISFFGLSITVMAAAYNPMVYQAQIKLKELGYNPGTLDGIWGKNTKIAIKEFQRDNGLPETGQLDKETMKKLGLKKGNTASSDVLILPKIRATDGDGSKVRATLRMGTKAKGEMQGGGLFMAVGSMYQEDTSGKGKIVASDTTCIQIINGLPITIGGEFFVNSDLTLTARGIWDGNKEGAVHILVGKVSISSYTFISDEKAPLTFVLTKEGYRYQSGVGSVKDNDTGKTHRLGK